MSSDHAHTRPDRAGHPAEVSLPEVRAQLHRILSSRGFKGSERLCRFLSWTVEQTLAGKAEKIKQYVVGREVFDRGPTFDPRIDSIVRTEAQRLRRRLSEYYETDGANDPILISFQPGSYTPTFTHRTRSTVKHTPPEIIHIEKRRHRIAVLPFSNLTADPDQDYICYGLADSIQGRLAGSSAFKVVSSFSASRFTSGECHFQRIGRDLGVDTLVQGSFQQVASTIRIQAAVIDLPSGAYIWSQIFDREMDSIFIVQDEIAEAVAGALNERFVVESAPKPVPPSPEAYKLYLRGRYLWNQISVEACEKAVECFARAISLFPGYAQAYAALVDAYHWLIFLGRRPAGLMGVTRRLTLQALRLDPQCAEAHVALGTVTAILDWRWDQAETFFRRGLELRPNYLPGSLQRGLCRLQTGDLEGSQADVEKGLDLDPLSPRSHRAAGIRSYFLRDFAGALTAFEYALELGPEIKNTRYLLGLALLQAGRLEEAVEAIRNSIEASTPGPSLGALVAAYTAAGEREKAKQTLRKLQELSARSFIPPAAFIHAYAGMHCKREALDWLEKAADERSTGLMVMKSDPLLDNLKDEPRFRAVLERMNIS